MRRIARIMIDFTIIGFLVRQIQRNKYRKLLYKHLLNPPLTHKKKTGIQSNSKKYIKINLVNKY